MNKSRRRRRSGGAGIVKVILILLIIAVAIAVTALLLRDKVEAEYAGDNEDEIIQGSVVRGSISTTVYGSGRLSDEDVENIDIPEGVELEKIYVQAGDSVEENALLARVNTNSVMSAMVSLNDEISSVDRKINTASAQTVDNLISSSVYGRVKEIYARTGDDVMELMLEKGALAVLSLDGYMAVDITNDTLREGDSVSVLTSLGYRYSGSVDKVIGDTVTVLVTDDGTFNNDSVTVTDFDGNEFGHGTLYIHDPLKIVGYTGTVGYIWADLNKLVYSGSSILELKEQAYTVELDALIVERQELEKELETLISIYRLGAIYAPFSGTIMEVNATDAETEEEEGTTDTDTTDTARYISISPDNTMSVSVSVDESDILSVSVGQEAEVTVNSLGDSVYEGVVTGIDRSGTSSSGVTVYTATVSIPKEKGMLSGMSASTTISIDGVENALLIPVDALNRTSSSYYVYTSYDDETNTLSGMKEVTIGISNANFVEITSGLAEGDVFYYTEQEDVFASFMPTGMGGGSSMNFGGSGGRPGSMSGGMPGSMSGGMPDGMGGGMPGGMGGGMPMGR